MTKILLVEDDQSLREIYSVRLQAEGYDLVTAGDGEEALTVAISEKPDLIISDVMMPKISGFEMLDLLRNNENTRNIRTIMLTALSSEKQRERSDQLGADRYLVKSQVGIEDIVRTVHEVLSSAPNNYGQPESENSMQTSSIPAANQSAFNPVSATDPNSIVGGSPKPMPNTPMNVPTIESSPENSSYNDAIQEAANISQNLLGGSEPAPAPPNDHLPNLDQKTITNTNSTQVATNGTLNQPVTQSIAPANGVSQPVQPNNGISQSAQQIQATSNNVTPEQNLSPKPETQDPASPIINIDELLASSGQANINDNGNIPPSTANTVNSTTFPNSL